MLILLVIGLAVLAYAPPEPARGTSVGGVGQVRYGVSQRKGFDTCSAPTTSQMQTWWTNSPYYDTIIYMGGSSRACPQPNLTSSWATTVHSQGWGFYLTWVGPQAPCSTYSSKISYDTSIAFNQGNIEAQLANGAADNLGFTGKNVVYYDLENYDETNVACRNAVNSFVNGWTVYNHQWFSSKAGMYANHCDGVYWASIANVPDDVWIALGNNDPDVWGLGCLPNNLWTNNQRIHQYTLNVYETYGGVQLFIDKDCASGLVTPHGYGGTDTACTVE